MSATNTTLTSGQIAAHKITLTAATVDTVTFPTHCAQVEVISDCADDLYVTVDGSTPASAGTTTWRIPKNTAPAVRVIPVTTSGNTVVKLISPGATTYSVTGPV